MKVNVNIINTGCILMSEAVTEPNLMKMILIVPEESLVRDRHTQTQGCLSLIRLLFFFLSKDLKLLEMDR